MHRVKGIILGLEVPSLRVPLLQVLYLKVLSWEVSLWGCHHGRYCTYCHHWRHHHCTITGMFITEQRMETKQPAIAYFNPPQVTAHHSKSKQFTTSHRRAHSYMWYFSSQDSKFFYKKYIYVVNWFLLLTL